MLKSTLVVDKDSVHTYTVAFSPTVLTIFSQSFTDAHAPQRLKKTIHGLLWFTVITFHQRNTLSVTVVD